MEVTTLQPEQPCLGPCMGREGSRPPGHCDQPSGLNLGPAERESQEESPCGAEGVKILPGGAALRLSILEMGPDWGFSPGLQPLVILAKTFFF